MDANKRTALNTVAVFCFLNGYRFAYDDEIRTVLKQFGTDERAINEADVVKYLHTHTEPLDLIGEAESGSPLDAVIADICHELVRRVAAGV